MTEPGRRRAQPDRPQADDGQQVVGPRRQAKSGGGQGRRTPAATPRVSPARRAASTTGTAGRSTAGGAAASAERASTAEASPRPAAAVEAPETHDVGMVTPSPGWGEASAPAPPVTTFAPPKVSYAPVDAFSPIAAAPAPVRNQPRHTGRPTHRRAKLTLSRIDPWSALKVSLVLAGCLFVVWMIAVTVLYAVLDKAGTFTSVNQTLSDVLGTHIPFNATGILLGAAVLGAFNVVIISALGTVAAFAYNVTSALVGGLDVTLAERD